MRLCHQLCSENIDRIWADAQSIIRYFYDLFTRRYPERLFKTVYAVRAFSRRRINVHSRSKLSVAAYLYIYLPVGNVHKLDYQLVFIGICRAYRIYIRQGLEAAAVCGAAVYTKLIPLIIDIENKAFRI